MKFTLLVTSPPHHENAWHALQFYKAALHAGHEVPRVFFYGDGAAHGNVLLHPPQDEVNVLKEWQQHAQQTELIVCVAAAIKRGVMDADTAQREEKPTYNLAPGFIVSGLGQLAEAMNDNDRLVSFPG
jgi:tRNA 2-thiouridine synthesizing protein D